MMTTIMKSSLRGIRRRIGAMMSLAVLLLLQPVTAFGDTWKVPPENLTYDVMYKWGLINKKAGSVSLRTNLRGDRFHARLTGATAPWADRFYKVRDTLAGVIDTRTFLPHSYEKIAYEGGDFSHDELIFSRSGNSTSADVIHRRKRKKDTQVSETRKELQAAGVTLDMLSSFYFMRQLDYAAMKKGQAVKVNIFSGSKKELLTIHFQGLEDVRLDNRNYPAYHITFTFTTDSGKTSSDNMDAWISTDSSRIPLLLEGKLPVGKVRCFYSGTMPSN